MESILTLSTKAGINVGTDVIINNERVYNRVIKDGSLGLGEAYMDGDWNSEHLDLIFYKIGRANLTGKDISWSEKFNLLWGWLTNLFHSSNEETSLEVAKLHYNLGNDFYARMLDPRMIYSCAYWRNAQTLEEAQTNKCKLICEKLKLTPGMTVLDIGCGFGGLARYMAEFYSVKVVAITNSKEQCEYAKEKNSHELIEYRLCDYRELLTIPNKFDRVVSVGMFEHVCPPNYREFFQIVDKVLKDDGIFLLHTIGGNVARPVGDRWINTYIFPNSVLPTLEQIVNTSNGIFIVEDVHNFGTDYDRTLMEWEKRFDATYEGKKTEKFYRMWKYYLLSSAGMFRARALQLYQVVFTKKKLNGYISVR